MTIVDLLDFRPPPVPPHVMSMLKEMDLAKKQYLTLLRQARDYDEAIFEVDVACLREHIACLADGGDVMKWKTTVRNSP